VKVKIGGALLPEADWASIEEKAPEDKEM